MKKLSYVLPCYNVERYIADCLDSIYSQDLPEDEFEVICVNDCSTDGTRSIIAKFEEIHDNLQLIDHKQNLTAGGARNTGISVARGEYIWFVDPDDMIVPKSAGTVYENAKRNDVDVLLFNYEAVDEKNHVLKKDNSFSDCEVCGGQEFVVKYFPNHFSHLCIVWRCLFKTGFLKQHELLFPIMRKAQDVVFLWKTMLVANRVQSIGRMCYLYRDNPYSVAKKTLDAHVVFSERVLFANEICKILENKDANVKPLIRQDMEKTMHWCVNTILPKLAEMSPAERFKFYDEITSHHELVKRLKPYMNRKHKLLFSTIGGNWLWGKKIDLLGKKDMRK